MTTHQTNWKFYTTNEEGWAAMLEACESAASSIELEQFIFVTNDIGKRFIEVCTRKAQQGVKVRFLWDAAGSFSFFGTLTAEELKGKGIELVFFKTLFPNLFKAHDYRSWYFRNHRRTLVIDARVAFTGSICVSDKMIKWRDTVVRLEGPVVKDMQKAFERMWDRALEKKLPKILSEKPSDKEFKYITNNPLPRRRRLYKHIIDAIHHSQKYIYITTPYFVPTRQLSRALRLAGHRGIDVKIIIPEWTDHPLVDLCSRTFFTKMLESGVKIYFYRGEMIHSKTVVIDGGWATIGTMNFDNVSLLYNFEANLVSTNKEFSSELREHFTKDLQLSEEVTFKNWKRRYWVEKFAGFFMYFIRDFL